MLEDPGEQRQPVPSPRGSSREEWTPIPLPVLQDELQPCELRWERPIAGDADGAVEIVCMAAGAKRLTIKGGDQRELLAACGSCTIPRESAYRPCLYLVPIKTEREGQLRDYFICRWFYRLKPEEPATTTDWMCGGCPYWFPRPPVHLIQDLEQAAQRMIRYHQDAWAGRLPPRSLTFWSRPWSPPVPRWRRLLRLLVSVLSGWWGLS
jgi:hypothetical protein